MTCIPCQELTRVVTFDSFKYEYCDKCKQEIEHGYPVGSKAEVTTTTVIVPTYPVDTYMTGNCPWNNNNLDVGTPVKVVASNIAPPDNCMWIYAIDSDGTYWLSDVNDYHMGIRSYGPCDSSDLVIDYSRGFMVKP